MQSWRAWAILSAVAVIGVCFLVGGLQKGPDTEAGQVEVLIGGVMLVAVVIVGGTAGRFGPEDEEGYSPPPRPRPRQRGLQCPKCGHPAPGTATPKWCSACEQPWAEPKPKELPRRTSWRVKGIRTELNLPWTMDVVATSTEEATSIAMGLGLEVHSVEPLS